MDFLWFLIVGALIGWAAGVIMKGRGFGLLGNILVGIFGAMLGGWLFGFLGFGARGPLAGILVSLVGAMILVSLAGLIHHHD